MNGLKRHVGRVTNTGQRCLVIWMQIPGLEDHALILTTDNLPDRIEHAVMQILESPEGQANPKLGEVLGSRIFPETKKTVLQVLHEMGFLSRQPIDNITMLPFPNMPFPLRDIIEKMPGAVIPPKAVTPPPAPVAPVGVSPHDVMQALIQESAGSNQPTQAVHEQRVPHQADVKFNPYGNVEGIAVAERNRGVALTLLAEARDLEAIANQKREQAYKSDPSLRPPEASLMAAPLRAVAEGDAGDPVIISITTDESPVKKTRAKKGQNS